MNDGDKPIANPYVVFREEFDDWAVLFNPDTGCGFGLNPTGVCVWKLLDGEHTIDDLLKEIRFYADKVPEEALEHVGTFIDELATEGLAGFASTGSGLPAGVKRPESFPSPRSGHVCELKSFKYEPPKLIELSGRRQGAYGLNCNPYGTIPGGECYAGSSASYCYNTGASATKPNCLSGASNSAECNYGTSAMGFCSTGGST